MANVESVPAGRYGKASLEKLGAWASVSGKLAQAENVRAALLHLSRILRPGGVLLATVPGVSHKIARYEAWDDYWRFTTMSARRLLTEVFPPTHVTVEAYGNVLTAIGFLHGIATHELSQDQLDYRDPDFEVTVTIRAVKPE